MGNMQEESMQTRTAERVSEKTLDSFVKGKYFRNGKEVEEKVYITDNDKLFVADKSFIDQFYDLTEEVKRLRATSQGLQAQIMNGGLAKHYKVSSKKEAVEKYGDEIIEDYWKSHKKEIIERVLPDIDKDSIIQEYIQAHKKSPHCWDKANQKRTQDCAERTAVYLADFYGGKSTKEIAEKHNAVRGTVQRLLRVNDKNDVERLMQAYLSKQDLFGGTGEAELRSWLEAKLNKKTESLNRKLEQAREFIAKNTPKVDSGDEWRK